MRPLTATAGPSRSASGEVGACRRGPRRQVVAVGAPAQERQPRRRPPAKEIHGAVEERPAPVAGGDLEDRRAMRPRPGRAGAPRRPPGRGARGSRGPGHRTNDCERRRRVRAPRRWPPVRAPRRAPPPRRRARRRARGARPRPRVRRGRRPRTRRARAGRCPPPVCPRVLRDVHHGPEQVGEPQAPQGRARQRLGAARDDRDAQPVAPGGQEQRRRARKRRHRVP